MEEMDTEKELILKSLSWLFQALVQDVGYKISSPVGKWCYSSTNVWGTSPELRTGFPWLQS